MARTGAQSRDDRGVIHLKRRSLRRDHLVEGHEAVELTELVQGKDLREPRIGPSQDRHGAHARAFSRFSLSIFRVMSWRLSGVR